MIRGLLCLCLLAWPVLGRAEILDDVKTLTAPAFAGRAAGSAEGAAAADLLAGWMADAGLVPAFADRWFQPFPLTGEGWAGEPLDGRTGRNVAGLWPGTGARADQVVIVGAHYDHLGRVAATPGEFYPGANDNASGVAALFSVIRTVTGADPAADRRTILFVCFDAEEVGLQGSSHLVGNLPVPLAQVHAMLNFDTVGQLTDDRLHVSGVGTADGLEALARRPETGGLDLALAQGGWSGSDHMVFNTREVPVVFLFGGSYLQYNTPEDTWDTLQPDNLARVANYAAGLVALLATDPAPLAWRMVGTPELRETEAEGPQNRDTWLGTLPDFTEGVVGYKLAGVFDGSPAKAGGLHKGDVLTKLGGMPVSDLATFTRALRTFNPGDLVEITVVRDGRSLNFTIVLGDRRERK